MLDHFEPAYSVNRQVGNFNILPNMVGDEVNLMTQRRKCLQALINADGRATRLEKGLRRDHQNFHKDLFFPAMIKKYPRIICLSAIGEKLARYWRAPPFRQCLGEQKQRFPSTLRCLSDYFSVRTQTDLTLDSLLFSMYMQRIVCTNGWILE